MQSPLKKYMTQEDEAMDAYLEPKIPPKKDSSPWGAQQNEALSPGKHKWSS